MPRWQLREVIEVGDDIRYIAAADRKAAAGILALLRYLKEAPERLVDLEIVDHTDYDAGFTVDQFRQVQVEDLVNMWRLAPQKDVEKGRAWANYRILYALDHRLDKTGAEGTAQTVWILAIRHRDDVYNVKSPH